MVGPRLFRSRWVALLWAAGVIWTAYDIVGAAPSPSTPTAGQPTDATGERYDAADLAALANTTAE